MGPLEGCTTGIYKCQKSNIKDKAFAVVESTHLEDLLPFNSDREVTPTKEE